MTMPMQRGTVLCRYCEVPFRARGCHLWCPECGTHIRPNQTPGQSLDEIDEQGPVRWVGKEAVQ